VVVVVVVVLQPCTAAFCRCLPLPLLALLLLLRGTLTGCNMWVRWGQPGRLQLAESFGQL
jgi:hypothetical protein